MSEDSLETLLLTAVHSVIATGRYAKKLREANHDSNVGQVSTFALIQDGKNCFVAGMGNIFTNFLITKQLSGYLGQGQPIASVFNNNYEDAVLKILHFDQTFKKQREDVVDHEYALKFYT